jgi:hypothetical protein
MELPRYENHRPYATVDDLSELAGPEHGVVELPKYMDWSGRHEYNLEVDGDLCMLYEIVLNEAPRGEDLRRFLNAELLVRNWSRLWLPVRVRTAWEGRFPQLTRAAPA